ncbi:efflux RND transporter periplasmic adaptor subunit [Gloeocapsopsis dulcis]|uniref:Efflux transporter periplasmic adaptor subunit n=1 Tax=Gloeocapsopsis dulcis AAB1 = 1H9 TaxID=1433147 RepID=A0A6N8FUG3_9CHRO|nr:efflux RND transporter periplasmic adaptor subunit [Gloeocapsopsis dulcis]MUL36414.1 efflux transporter periplasmic adaptor subunit [Gloeocapsopsis dulcis AAB1 = 1H9]WNN88092.1 efflux RND transporter periplasmic adaptor subunit [Gloeocapsopsis dulcis]
MTQQVEADDKLESKEVIVVDNANYKKVPQRRSRQNWLISLIVGTGLGVAIALGGMRFFSRPTTAPNATPQQTAAPPNMSVTVEPVRSTQVARSLNVTGTVAARDLIPVLPQTNGLQIRQILVREGESVREGQAMAILDDAVIRAQIDQSRANIESAQAVVGQRQAALAQARASLAEAERNLQRYEQLASNGAISRQELDARATATATAREAVRVAQANISSAEADVRSSRASLQQLQTQLGQTVVRAPASGLVAEAIAKIGDVVSGSQQLFSIIQNNALELAAQVPAVQLPQVQVSAPATVTSDADSRVQLQGRVREIAPLVDTQSRQATVRIDLPTTSLLRPGMFARAAITSATVPGITVPAKAVVPQPDGNGIVFVLQGEDTVQARSVELGEVLNDGNVEISSGLNPGDRVVVSGAGYLTDGDRVRVVEGS